jgi:hypothetical protein
MKYFLSILLEPQCMFCKINFNIEFLIKKNDNDESNFTNNFFWTGAYKEHKKNILFDIFKNKFAEYQIFAGYQIQINKLQLQTNKNNNIIYDAQYIYTRVISVNDEIINNYVNKESILSYIENLKKENEKNKINLEELYTLQKNDKKINKINGNCTVTDCRGFINQDWECGFCKTKHCEKCGTIIETEHVDHVIHVVHVCNKKNVKSFEFIKKNSKSCPSCNVNISKIDGCSMMWCTMCKTAFDWETLNISNTTHIHNPHYFEWMNANTNGNNQMIIGGNCFNEIINMISNKDLKNNLYIFYNEIMDNIRRCNEQYNIYERNLKKLGVDYLSDFYEPEIVKEILFNHYLHKKYADIYIEKYEIIRDVIQTILNNYKSNTASNIGFSKIYEFISIIYKDLEIIDTFRPPKGQIVEYNLNKQHINNGLYIKEYYNMNFLNGSMLKFYLG